MKGPDKVAPIPLNHQTEKENEKHSTNSNFGFRRCDWYRLPDHSFLSRKSCKSLALK
jgi:hypothetical protein